MKIIRFRMYRMRNAEHFQYMTEFKDLFTTFSPSLMKIMKFFVVFMELFKKEDECLVILQKSEYTEQMNDEDLRRDSILRILGALISAALLHTSEGVRAAAKRLEILFKTYGNLAQKPNDEETSGIYNLTQDLEGRFVGDIELIGGTDWVAQLKASNEKYDALVKNRDIESTEKPEAKMKQIRTEIDIAYYDIVTAIEMFAKLTDVPAEIERYNGFISSLNAITERYKNRIAQREGVAKAKKEKNTNPDIITSED